MLTYMFPPVSVTAQDSSPHVLSLPAPQAGLLGTLRWFARDFLLWAWQPAAAKPTAKENASRQRRRGIRHLNSYILCSMPIHTLLNGEVKAKYSPKAE